MPAGKLINESVTIIGSISVGDDTVSNAHVNSSAAIDAGKTRHLHKIGTDCGIDYAGTVVEKRKVIFTATGACTIRKFGACLVVKNTTGVTHFRCNKNGDSILSSNITFSSSDSSGDVKTGSLSVTDLAADDVVEVQIIENLATMDGTGPFCWIEIDEAAN